MTKLYQSLTSRDERGFTLIELLVVIAIIAILAALILAALLSAQQGSRDSRRKSDLNQYKTALSQYQADKASYPVGGENSMAAGNLPFGPSTNGDTLSGNGNMTNFIGDPSNRVYSYTGTATDFGVCADLERGSANFAVGPTYSGNPKNASYTGSGTACGVQG